MGMCVQKSKVIVFLAFLACLCGCGPMDGLLSSTGTYKVNININGAALNELSFLDSNVKIQPYFEEPVSNDPDVTALVVFLRNSRGNTVGWRVVYTLESVDESEVVSSEENPEGTPTSTPQNDDLIIAVKSLDGELPVFPFPNDLPDGRYTLVSHVMSGKDILQRIEKSIYYMGRTVFSYDGIQVYLPGITESSHVIPKGMVVMLETVLDFDSSLNPYIVWYNGRRKIGEGYFSDGAGKLLWKAPEQSGFYSLRAEVFPVENFDGLSGYQKEISLLVSSKDIEVNLISENIVELLHWYTFEGNLNDSKLLSSIERAIKPDAKNIPRWAGVNGTYGLITGPKDIFSFPKVSVSNNGTETWQALFRFNPLNDGVILSVQFDTPRDISMSLKVENHNLVLELVSSEETVSQNYALPEQNTFIKAGIVFSILPEMLAANINIVGNYVNKSEFDKQWASIDVEIKGGFQLTLGQKSENDAEPQLSPANQRFADEGSPLEPEAVKKSEYNAIWDEFALYYMPPMEILDAFIIADSDEQPQDKESTTD